MGRAGDLSTMLWEISRDMAEWHTHTGQEAMYADDQRWLMRRVFDRPAALKLDLHGLLFQSLHGVGTHSLLDHVGKVLRDLP